MRMLSTTSKRPTGIVMLNMGGPATTGEVGGFLERLLSDRELLGLSPSVPRSLHETGARWIAAMLLEAVPLFEGGHKSRPII
jgi:protoheme ferro-lyase